MSRRDLRLLLVVVILLGASGYILARQRGEGSQPNPLLPVVCANCGTEFQIKSNDEIPVCPNCGCTERLRRVYFRCTRCGHVFVAFECDPRAGTVREPGGDWMPRVECTFEAACPECEGSTQVVRDVRKPGS